MVGGLALASGRFWFYFLYFLYFSLLNYGEGQGRRHLRRQHHGEHLRRQQPIHLLFFFLFKRAFWWAPCVPCVVCVVCLYVPHVRAQARSLGWAWQGRQKRVNNYYAVLYRVYLSRWPRNGVCLFPAIAVCDASGTTSSRGPPPGTG
jgi:hypothetical protein